MYSKVSAVIAAVLLASGNPIPTSAEDLALAPETTARPGVVMIAPSHFVPAEPAHIPVGKVPPGTVVFSQTLQFRATGVLTEDVYRVKRSGGKDRVLAAKGTPVYQVHSLRDDQLQDFWCVVPDPAPDSSAMCFPELKGQVYGVPAGNSFFRGRLSLTSRVPVSEIQVSETAANEKRYVMEVRAMTPRGKGTMRLEQRMSELGTPEPKPIDWFDDRPGVAYLINGNGEDVAAVIYNPEDKSYKVDLCPPTICKLHFP